MEKIVLFFYFVFSIQCLPMEPVCSKFDYEYKTLEVMLRTERHVEDMKREMLKIQEDVNEKLQQLTEFKLKQEDAFTKLQEQVEEQTVQIKKESDDLSTKVNSEINTFKDEFRELKGSSSEVIAFSVTDPSRTLVNGVPTFGQQITNLGNGYNQTTGKFTCTIPGLYMFTLTVASASNDLNTYCRIQLNSKNIVISQVYKNIYTTAANTVFLMLSIGDIVSLGNCGGMETTYNWNGGTSFSGVLLSSQ